MSCRNDGGSRHHRDPHRAGGRSPRSGAKIDLTATRWSSSPAAIPSIRTSIRNCPTDTFKDFTPNLAARLFAEHDDGRGYLPVQDGCGCHRCGAAKPGASPTVSPVSAPRHTSRVNVQYIAKATSSTRSYTAGAPIINDLLGRPSPLSIPTNIPESITRSGRHPAPARRESAKSAQAPSSPSVPTNRAALPGTTRRLWGTRTCCHGCDLRRRSPRTALRAQSPPVKQRSTILRRRAGHNASRI